MNQFQSLCWLGKPSVVTIAATTGSATIITARSASTLFLLLWIMIMVLVLFGNWALNQIRWRRWWTFTCATTVFLSIIVDVLLLRFYWGCNLELVLVIITIVVVTASDPIHTSLVRNLRKFIRIVMLQMIIVITISISAVTVNAIFWPPNSLKKAAIFRFFFVNSHIWACNVNQKAKKLWLHIYELVQPI